MNKKINTKNVEEVYILEEEISLTTEEIHNYGLKYTKKKNQLEAKVPGVGLRTQCTLHMLRLLVA